MLAISFAIAASVDNFAITGDRLIVGEVVRLIDDALVDFMLLDEVLTIELDPVETALLDVGENIIEVVLDDIREFVKSVVEVLFDVIARVVMTAVEESERDVTSAVDETFASVDIVVGSEEDADVEVVKLATVVDVDDLFVVVAAVVEGAKVDTSPAGIRASSLPASRLTFVIVDCAAEGPADSAAESAAEGAADGGVPTTMAV